MDHSSSNLPESSEKLLANLSWTQGLARRLVRSQESADELVQQTWFRLLHNAPPSGSAERPWIAAVMRRTLGDTFRSARRRKRRETQFAEERSRLTDHRHSDELDVHQDLVERVKELDAPLRRVILLRYFDDLPLAEIAAVEGLKVSGVKSRLNRAHERLRARLKERPGTAAGAWFLLQAPKSQPALPAALLAPTALLAMKPILTAAAVLVLALLGIRLLAPADVDHPQEITPPEAETGVQAKLDRVPAPTRSRTIAAESPVSPSLDAAAGIPSVPPPTEPATAFKIRVVDETGKPRAGAPVSLAGNGEYESTIWQGTTSASGLASVPIESVDKARSSSAHSGFLAALDVPCGPEGTAVLNLNHLPDDPVELVMPGPRGSLTVEFLDEWGTPMTVRPSVSIEAIHATGGRQTVRRQPKTLSTSVTFDSLELDSAFRMTAFMPGPWDFINQDIAGPTMAGEEKAVELRFTATGSQLVGRLLNPDGTPFFPGEAYVEGTQRSLDNPSLSAALSIAVAADGRFQAGLRQGINTVVAGGIPKSSPCTISLMCRREGIGTGCVTATTEALAPGPGEALDVGDIVLHPAPAKIAGVVRMPSGRPATGAVVRAIPLDPESAQTPAPSYPNPIAWTNEEGQFAFYHVPLEGSFALRASHGQLASPNSAPVRDGDLRVELTLQPSMSLTGSILPPDGLETGMVRVRVQKGSASPLSAKTIKVAPDWTFRMNGLIDQPCTLQVTDARGREVFLEVESVMPSAAQAPQDRRLAQLDLRRSVLPIRMTVEDAAGQRIDKGSAHVGRRNLSIQAGVLEAAIPWMDGELLVGAPGMQAQSFPLSLLPELVVLKAGLRVRLVAPSPWPSGVDRSRMEVSMMPGRARGDTARRPLQLTDKQIFGSQDSVELMVPGPGTYTVRWRLKQTPQEMVRQARERKFGEERLRIQDLFKACSKQQVDILERSGVQEIDLSL